MSDLSKYEIDPTLIKANFKALKENQINSENIKIPGQITFSESNIYLGTGQKAQIYRGEVLAKSPRGTYDWTKEEYMNATKNDNQLYCLIEPLDDYDIDWAIKDYVQQMGNKIVQKDPFEIVVGPGGDFTDIQDAFDYVDKIVWSRSVNGNKTKYAEQSFIILKDGVNLGNNMYLHAKDYREIGLKSETGVIKVNGNLFFWLCHLNLFFHNPLEYINKANDCRIYVQGSRWEFASINYDTNKTLQEPKMLVMKGSGTIYIDSKSTCYLSNVLIDASTSTSTANVDFIMLSQGATLHTVNQGFIDHPTRTMNGIRVTSGSIFSTQNPVNKEGTMKGSLCNIAKNIVSQNGMFLSA